MLEQVHFAAVAKYAGGPSIIGAATMAFDPAIAVAAITVLGGLITAVITYRQSKTEKKVDANETLIDQLQEQLDKERIRNDLLETRLREMSAELEALRLSLTTYRIGAATLAHQIALLGEEPMWAPPPTDVS